jgi:hypothetical protein
MLYSFVCLPDILLRTKHFNYNRPFSFFLFFFFLLLAVFLVITDGRLSRKTWVLSGITIKAKYYLSKVETQTSLSSALFGKGITLIPIYCPVRII